MSKVGCDCGDEYANTEVEKIKTVFCDCCRKYDWELKLEKAEERVKELEADLAKSHDDWYAMGWREALEIAQEKIMRIER